MDLVSCSWQFRMAVTEFPFTLIPSFCQSPSVSLNWNLSRDFLPLPSPLYTRRILLAILTERASEPSAL
jgi:hypothetical protein